MVRLYIADLDALHIRNVRRACAGSRSVQVVGEASSGKRTLDDILRLRPDVLLTDIQLTELDGIALLRECGRLRNPPAVVICTRFYSAASMDWAFRYGAAYFLCKPLDYARLPELISECAGRPREEGPMAEAPADDHGRRAAGVRALLKDMGIPPKLNGSAYLVESVLRAQDDALLLRNLSRGLYVELAGRMDSTVPRVERSLRSAIGIAYERGTLKRHFSRRPTNRQFIEFLLRESEAMARGDAGRTT